MKGTFIAILEAMYHGSWSAIFFKKLNFWVFSMMLFHAPLLAQQGIFFREEALDQAVQEALPSYLNHFLSEISETIISQAKKNTQEPFKRNIQKELPIIRDFFNRRTIQIDRLEDLRQQKKSWLDQIKAVYLKNKSFERDFVQSEMTSWEVFFESLLEFSSLEDEDDKISKLIKDFKESRISAMGGSEAFQSFLEASELEIFQTNREIFLGRLKRFYYSGSQDSELADWFIKSQENWEEILDELENWDLEIDVDIAIKPEVQNIKLDPKFGGQTSDGEGESSDVVGRGILTAQPEIKFQRLALSLLRRGTAERIEIATDLAIVDGDPKDWGHPDAIIWHLTKPLVIQAEGSFDFDMRRTRAVPSEQNSGSLLQPIDIQIEPVQTNLDEIQVQPEGVEKLMSEIFNQAKISLALERLSQQALFDRVKTQFQDDIKNYLEKETLNLSIIILRDENGKIDFEIGIKSEKLDAKIKKLQEEDRFVTEIISQTNLNVEDFKVNLQPGAKDVEIEILLPETKSVTAQVGDFDFPEFLFEDESNDLVRSIMSYFDQNSIDFSEASLEAQLRLSQSSEDRPRISLHVPIQWEQTAGGDLLAPNFSFDKMAFNLDALEGAKIEEVRFQATNESDWVELNFQDTRKMQDQLYSQMSELTQSFENLMGEDFELFLNRELQSRLQKLVLQVGAEDDQGALNEEKVRILDFEFPDSAVKIDWDAEDELVALRRKNSDRRGPDHKRQELFKPALDRLPKEFRVFRNEAGVVTIKTDLKLPQTFHIQLQNIDDEEAFIESLEFSVAANEAQTVSVFWKIIQDAQGRLIILPEISNLDSVISAYQPLLDGPDALVARGVRPKSYLGRGAEWLTRRLRQTGSKVGLAASLLGQVYIENEKRERITKKINETFNKKLQENLPDLVLDLLRLTNGYVLEPLDQRLSERAGYNPEAVMPSLQKDFERIVDGLIEKRLLRGDLAHWKLGETKVLDRLENEVEAYATDRFESEVLGQPYENLRTEVSDTLINTPNALQSVIEGNYAPQDEVPFWIRRLEAGEEFKDIEGVPSDINTFAQDFVPFLEEQINAPLIEMKIPEEISESFARREDREAQAENSSEPMAPQMIFYIPDHFCVPEQDTSLSEVFESAEGLVSEPQSVVPIYAFHDSQGGSLIPTHVSDEIRELISNHLRKRYWPEEDPQRVEARTPDAVAFMSLESLHENLIAPNLEEFKRYIREVAALQKPGTDLRLNDMKLELKETDGELKPFVKIKMRLRYKNGLLDYDTGRDEEGKKDFEFSLPVKIGLHNAFDSRPEFESEEWNSGYRMSLSFDYPVEFDNPNFHDFIDEWIKKEVAYPELIESFLFEKSEENPSQRSRRVIEIPIPQTLGMPLIMKDAPIEARQVFFDQDSSGQDYMLLGLKFGEFRSNFSTEAPFELPFDTDSIKESLQKYYGQDNFFLEEDSIRLLSNMFERSKERRRAFHSDESLMMNIRSETSGISFDENGKGHFNFEVLLSSQREKLPPSVRVKMPFEVFKAGEDWVLDPDAAVEVEASSAVSSEVASSILEFFKETNPEPVILHQFQVISKEASDSQKE